MKRSLISLAIGLGLSTGAFADPIPTLPLGPVYAQFNNLEQVDVGLTNSLIIPGGYDGTNTQGNWGVINVSSLQDGAIATPHQDIGGGPNFFSYNGTTSGQITGVFGGIQLTSASTATGGWIDLYWSPTATITANCLAGNTCAPDASTVTLFSTGTFLGRLDMTAGIDPTSSTTDLVSNTDLTTTTVSGHADGFLSVDLSKKGLWSDQLNGNWFELPTTYDGLAIADLRFSTFYNSLASWGNIAAGGTTLGVRSNDPLRAFTVPEPATLGLLGLGLLGMGLTSRRRKST